MFTIEHRCFQEAVFFHALEGTMFSGLRSDSVVLSHVWLGLPAVEVVSSLMEACISQQQLHGDGLH